MVNKKELSKDLMDFVENVTWIFAKTYASTWPHEYIVQEKIDKVLFLKLANHIDNYGYKDYFYKTPQIYFIHKGYTYWHMGDIINRCISKDTYHQRKKDNRLPKKINP
jgi:hypothetical protein